MFKEFRDTKILSKFQLKKQIGGFGIIRIISSIAGLLSVGLSIRLLGNTNYGTWITIYTIISWISILEGGIAASTKNAIGKFHATGNIESLNHIYSTSRFLGLLVLILISVVFNIILELVNFLELLGVDESNRTSVINVFFSGLIILFGKNTSAILSAIHKNHLANFNQLLSQISFVMWLGILVIQNNHRDMEVQDLSRILLLTTLLSYLMFELYISKYHLGFLRFKFNSIKKESINILRKTSVNFWAIQISSLLLFSTDIILLNKFAGPLESTKYAVTQKYYGIILLAFGILTSPLWSLIINLFENKKYKELKEINRLMKIIWITVFILSISLILTQDLFFSIWLGAENPNASSLIHLLMFFYSNLLCYLTIQGSFLNGTNNLSLQKTVSIFAAIVNLSFTYLGLKFLNQGIEWVLSCTILVHIFVVYIYYNRITLIVESK